MTLAFAVIDDRPWLAHPGAAAPLKAVPARILAEGAGELARLKALVLACRLAVDGVLERFDHRLQSVQSLRNEA